MGEELPAGGVEYGNREVALGGEILRTQVGSEVHGLALSGSSDHDELGVYIEPESWVLGPVDHRPDFIWRSADEGQSSGSGDTDLTLYSLKKYLQLALKGNPTILLPLFAAPSSVLRATAAGDELRGLREAFLSLETVERFLGYMRAQHDRMLGQGKKSVPNRPELIARHGWDTKYGSHALRLAYQGVELATFGTLTLPMPAGSRARVLAVKRGEASRDDVSAEIAQLHAEARAVLDAGRAPLPAVPDVDRVTEFAVRAQREFWARTR